jgi:alanine dehydrogenase
VESGAGEGAGFDDYDYERLGATIVFDGQELYAQSSLLLKVLRPTMEEIQWMHEGQILLGFLGLIAAAREEIELLIERRSQPLLMKWSPPMARISRFSKR